MCRNTKRYVIEEVKIIIENLGFELLDKSYHNNKERLTIKDKDGYYYFISLHGLHLSNEPYKFHQSNIYTIQNIKLWCKLNDKPFELIDGQIYERNDIKLKWKCLKPECGEIFSNICNDIFGGHGCGVCSGNQVTLLNCLATKNPELAQEWHPTKNGDLTPYNVTANSNKEVWWLCKDNPKHEWHSEICNRNCGNGCPFCSGRYPCEEHNLLVDNPELCKEWDYNKNKRKPEEYTSGSSQYAWWKCKECNNEWKAKIVKRINGNGCPECSKSHGEKKIDNYLIKNNWIKISQDKFETLSNDNKYNFNYYIPQKTFKGLVGIGGGLLSYDHYIPKHNLLIEFQGEQHERYVPGFHKSEEDFYRQVEHDKRKREYAKANNIKLLEIWYYEFDRIEEIFESILIIT